tara:strand:- start:416 stop:631 length:216 start_codon:yes stop_codon:yes gene_type:complete
MLTSIAGSVSATAGDVVTVDDLFGLRLINTSQAEHVDADRVPVEAATITAPETATKRRPAARTTKRGRRRG